MLGNLFGMKVAHPDGRPLIHLTWPLIRAIDAQLHIAGDIGQVVIKVRKGRVAGFTAQQETLWSAGELAA